MIMATRISQFHLWRRVFSSRLDGKRITGKDVEDLIDSNSFKKLDDDDAVSLCCIGILQLVLLGLEDRRPVPNWILRLANDRDGWDEYPWGSYVWPTLYYNLRDANVKRWLPLYATESTNEDDKKTYSLLGFTWAFKMRSSNSTASSGSNPAAYQEFMAEQYELDRKAKMTVLERESEDRRRLIQSQRIAEDMRVLQIDTRGMDPVDAAIINAQKAKIRAAYPPPPN
ncbi:hypothetical protein Tco_1568044 [Tanacetum coccineum]